jgi:hypothetical protein
MTTRGVHLSQLQGREAKHLHMTTRGVQFSQIANTAIIAQGREAEHVRRFLGLLMCPFTTCALQLFSLVRAVRASITENDDNTSEG